MNTITRMMIALQFLVIGILHGAQVGFNQMEFDTNAARYGNKAANLFELQKIAHFIRNFLSIDVQVPSFFPFSNESVHSYLQVQPFEDTKAYDEIMRLWDEFVRAQPTSNTNLTPEALKHLAAIRALFETNLIKNHNWKIDELVTNAGQFLQKAQQDKKLLMVRSTGREDSKELANAGGNASVAGVQPELGAIAKGMGIVLASYFSEQSIGQRLAAHDKQLFDTPFMPVLSQKMIGEPYGGAKNAEDIPVSGVMFSQEAEGRTQGVTHIQTTYGLGEGIVNGLVPFDTYYIGKSLIIHPLISIKSERMIIAADGITTQRAKNPQKLIQKSSLSKEILLNLKKIADYIQQYYNQPMDIEFVVLKNTIYLVQARPIQELPQQPSFVSAQYYDAYIKNANMPLSFTVIGAAGGATRIITERSAVIAADTIAVALREFLARTDKEIVQGIPIGQFAPALSHEATVFRAASKPVVFVEDFARAKEILDQNKFPFFLDPQRSELILFEATDTVKTPGQALEKGWFTHPIAAKVSVMLPLLSNIKEEEKEFYPQIATSILLNQISSATTDPEQALKAAQSILARVNKKLHVAIVEQQNLAKAKKQTNPGLVKDLQLLVTALGDAVYEFRLGLDDWKRSNKTSADALIRLYPAVFIRALVRQDQQPERYVNNFSFVSSLKIEKEEQKAVSALDIKGPYRAFIAQYAKVAQFGLTDEVQQAWTKFLKDLASLDDTTLQGEFAELIKIVASIDMLPLWLNTAFFQAAQKNVSAQETALLLVHEYQTNKEFVQKLYSLNRWLKNFNVQALAEPGAFDKSWQDFTQNTQYFMSDEFLTQFKSANGFGKMFAISVMNQYVSQFDTAIKALTGSTLYSDVDLKVGRFQQLLFAYERVLEHWANLIDPLILKSLLDDNTFKDFDGYVKKIDGIIKKSPMIANQFLGSRMFNVSAAALGSKALWQRSVGNAPTLEDMFTLIHQNLLVFLSILNRDLISNVPIPSFLKQTLDYAHAIKFGTHKASLIGLDFQFPVFIYRFNVPLRNHSSMFQISYNIKNRSLIFTGQFVGDHPDRWLWIKTLVTIMAQSGDLEVEQNSVDATKGLVTFALNIKTPEDARMVAAIFALLAKATFGPISDFFEFVLKTFGPDRVNKLAESMKAVVIEAVEHDNFSISLKVLDLFLVLLDNNQGFVSAAQAAQKAIESSYETIARKGFALFEILLDNDQGFNEAAQAAQKGVESKVPHIPSIGVELFEALFNQDQGFTQAMKAAEKVLENDDNEKMWITGLKLFSDLVDHGKGFTQALQAAQKAVKSKDRDIAIAGLKLFKALVNNNQGFIEAIQAAQSATESDIENIHSLGLALFESLVNKDQGFTEAAQAAHEASKSNVPAIRSAGLNLFKALVNKNQRFIQATHAAQQTIAHGDITTYLGLELFELLVNKDQGFAEAAYAVQEVAKMDNLLPLIKEKAMQLKNLLNTKGYIQYNEAM